MKYFDSMIPCGIQHLGVTSISQILNDSYDKYDIMENIAFNFIQIFEENIDKV